MNVKPGDLVRVRMIKDQHILQRYDNDTCNAEVVEVNEAGRWIRAKVRIGKATIQECFKPDDFQLVKS